MPPWGAWRCGADARATTVYGATPREHAVRHRSRQWQAVAALLLCVVGIKVYHYYTPFVHASDDQFSELAQWVLASMFLAALMARVQAMDESSESQEKIGILLILVVLSAFGVLFWFIVKEVRNEVQKGSEIVRRLSVEGLKTGGDESTSHGAEGEGEGHKGGSACILDSPRLFQMPNVSARVDGGTGAFASGIANRGGTLVQPGALQHFSALVFVARRTNHHVRDAAQIRQIKGAMMGRAVLPDEARSINRQRDVQILQRHIVD